MYTFQDYQKTISGGDTAAGVERTIKEHQLSAQYMIARDADAYNRQQNTTIINYARYLYDIDGKRVPDTVSSSCRLCSNFFNAFNTQRTNYLLGNGTTFEDETVKDKLGVKFDTKLQEAGNDALIHGVSFLFWNVDHVHEFKLTEFAPLWDEETGALRAGVRFWQVDPDKPVIAVLYEEDGFTKFKGNNLGTGMEVIIPKRAYRVTTRKAAADAEPEIVGEENYGVLPIIPVYGTKLKQSTLVGLKPKIDAYDLIQSGFANDINDCAEIYWIIGNAGGMSEKDLVKFRDRLKLQHIAAVEDQDETPISAQTMEIPVQARSEFLNEIRSSLYEDFGALDVHTIAAGATNDHIDAAYQALDDRADDFEYQIIEAVQALLELLGITDAVPTFKRNKISNLKEQTDMILSAAQYLDEETILNKLPFITPDEVEDIVKAKADEQVKELLWNDTQKEDQTGGEDPEQEK